MNVPEIQIEIDGRTVLTLTPPVVLGHERSGDAVQLRMRTSVRAHLAVQAQIQFPVRLTREELIEIATDLGLRLTDVESSES